jgi:peptidoglycan/LPS O-acetylase OafA/YrhL
MAALETALYEQTTEPLVRHHGSKPLCVSGSRYKSLDMWRGVACLSVLLYHSAVYLRVGEAAPPWSWIGALLGLGWAGVPVFFVISGYCISATADAERRKSAGTKRYFKRRFRRIFPPYWIAIGLFVVFVGGLEVLIPGLFSDRQYPISMPWRVGAWDWLWNLTLTESWMGSLSGKESFFLTPAWTLCYEEQFYAVTGILLVVCRRRFFSGALAVTALTIAARLTGMVVPGAFFDGRWLMFAAGIAVYWVACYPPGAGRKAAVALLIAGLVMAALHPRLPGETAGHYSELTVAFVFAVVVLLLHRWDGWLVRFVPLRPLMFCGTLCYSLYLLHWPIVKAISHGAVLIGLAGAAQTVLIVIPVCCACAIAAAWWFHRAVEVRFMNPSQTQPVTPLAKAP